MNIHALLHIPYESPGYIEKWIRVKNHNLTYTKFYEPFNLPDIKDIDWLIVMGGPMSVYEDDKYPWLKAEKEFIKQAVEKNKLVLGICLGSQLIAEVLGAKVYPNKLKEIGWFKIKTTEAVKENAVFNFFPKETVVFHWHGDTYDIPAGAVRLAESEAAKNQAFIFNNKVIGLQFHIEVTELLLNNMVDSGIKELKKDIYVQTAEEIRSGIHNCTSANLLLHNSLDNLEGITGAK